MTSQNIFLARGPRGIEPKVLDFGISKGNDTKPGALTGTGMIGTPFYFAPEQILDARSAGPASDQYALGVIMYECLSGRRPYEDDNLFRVFQAIVEAKLAVQMRPNHAESRQLLTMLQSSTTTVAPEPSPPPPAAILGTQSASAGFQSLSGR